LPLATYIRAPRLPSTPLNCVSTPCRTSLVRTAVLHSYLLRICRHYRWLHSYVLLVCRQHRQPAFVCVSKPRCYPLLSYIRTCCSSAIDIVDLCSYALQKLVGTHCSPTFVCAAHMQSTPLTCVRTCCRTSLVHTAVLHSYMLRVCRHCRSLHSYMLLVCRQHRQPAFVRVAKPRWYALLSYIRTRCSYAVNTADLCSYALQDLVGMHGCPPFVHASRLPPLPLSAFVVGREHSLPVFVRVAKPRWYALLSYIRTRCSSAVNIIDLRAYALQNLVGTHCCPTFIHAARLPPLPLSTFVVCRQHRLPVFVRVAKPRWYALLSYIRTHCS